MPMKWPIGKPSTFLDQAKARHVPTSEGFGMLVGQAIRVLFHLERGKT